MRSIARRTKLGRGLRVIGKAVVLPAILLFAASMNVDSTVAAATREPSCGMNVRTGKPGGVYGLQQEWIGNRVVQAITVWSNHPLVLGFHPGYVGGAFGQKIIWRVRKSLEQDITLQGRNVRTGQVLQFAIVGQRGAFVQRIGQLKLSRPSIDNLGQWRGYASNVYVPSPGCYVLRARWPHGGWSIRFNAETNLN